MLAPGDQVVADGPLLSSTGLRLDESILTGEAKAVARRVGDEVRSGSFVVEGTGSFEVAAVGAESYAERIAGTAREFRHPRSPLERAINRLLYVLLGVMVPLGAMLIVALWKQDVAIGHAVETAVAGMVTLIPEGLVLLVSITYAAAAVRMARAGALSQQLNAIESLASVDTICIDKTGTLTEPGSARRGARSGRGRDRGRARDGARAGSRPRPRRGTRRSRRSRQRGPPTPSPPTSRPVSLPSPLERPADRRRPLRARCARSSSRSASSTAVAREHQEAGRRVVGFGVTTAAFPR